MAKIADYLPGGEKHPNTHGGIDDQIADAQQQQQTRQRDAESGQFVATPENVNWEQRYKDLEKLNSRQAQDLGTYRKLVDDYIAAPTPEAPVVAEESKPITMDDFYDNPDETVKKAVESHPAIQEARELKKQLENDRLEESIRSFHQRHPKASEIGQDPAFRNWVEEDPVRIELYNRGNQYDLSAADALFQLYEASSNLTQVTSEQQQRQAIEAASLEDSSAIMVQEPPQYSRSEYVNKLMRARQGDLEADDWVKRNAAGYRQALAVGNVRD